MSLMQRAIAELRSLARAVIDRTPEENQRVGDRASTYAKLGLFAAMAIAGAVVIVPPIARTIGEWRDFTPVVSIERPAWRAIYGEAGEGCSVDRAVGAACPAAAGSGLWKSGATLADDGHFEKIRALGPGGVFWLGAVIPREDVERAVRAGADRLYLGWFTGGYDIWINGHYWTGSEAENYEPFMMALPGLREAHEPVRVAIRVRNTTGSAFPGQLGALWPTGLHLDGTAQALLRYLAFGMSTRPVSTTFAYGVLSLLFLFLWISAPKKQEYFYVALYCGVVGASQITLSHYFTGHVSREDRYSLYSILRFYEGAFALLLSLAIGRMRKAVFPYLTTAFVVGPLLGVAMISAPDRLLLLDQRLAQFWVPGCYLLGGAACVLKALYLSRHRGDGVFVVSRVKRLLSFSAIWGSIGLFYFLQARGLFDATGFTFWDRYFHLGTVVAVLAIVFWEYKERERLLEETPVSPFHLHSPLPTSLTGYVIDVDLRSSERLLLAGAAAGRAGEYLARCQRELRLAIRRHGGVITHRIGDQIKALFVESNGAGGALFQALDACRDAAEGLDHLAEELREEGVMGPGDRITFRAGLAHGSLRPVWEDEVGRREPSWEETGAQNVFKDAARLEKFGDTLSAGPHESVIVMKEEIAREAERAGVGRMPSWSWGRRSVAAQAKGALYRVGALVSQPNTRLDGAEAA